MKDWDNIITQLLEFRKDRDWEQFHNPKDLALALSIEASELNELFLWKSPEAADKEKIKHEIADIFSFLLLLVHEYKLDISAIMAEKIHINNEKYPVAKAKGNATKYTEL
ncbi:nucleotide pyrophosphohydrolase [Mucilaginibacter agri]|uniref:Nucleotide pyrophosphohydrolase n=1 Tax=Mucilaginibacter agri TaxID=2695265 RepID=A0A965ZCR3_9SPHI|nr:nucleotide pyrophosphohydrolase [Mucilaginibacter agri]NCD67888.1 nucleotide pyrophosphohydrolase [Mucilaginibacter agri]